MRKYDPRKNINKEDSKRKSLQKRQSYTVDSFDTNMQKRQATNASRLEAKEKNWQTAKFYIKCFLFSLLFSFIIFFFLTYPGFAVKEISVNGCKYSDKEKIRQICGIFEEKNLFLIEKSKASRNILKISEINNVQIYRNFPDKVSVKINERKPVATIDNGSRIYLIDKDEFVFHTLGESEKSPNVPNIIAPYKISRNLNIEESYERFVKKTDENLKILSKQSDVDMEKAKEEAHNAKKERRKETYNLGFALDITKKAKNNNLKIKDIIIKENNYALLQMADNGPIVEFGPLADIDIKITLLSDIYELKEGINEEAGEIYLINERAATYKKKSSMNKPQEPTILPEDI